MTKKELLTFYEKHPLQDFSAARFEYSLYYHPEILDVAKETFQYVESDIDVIVAAQIEGADIPELCRLMRKRVSGDNKKRLREKLLANEDAMLPIMQKRCMTSVQDMFIENALHFFLHSEGNYTGWIMENYKDFRSDYLKSMFCLVLGIRGDQSLFPFLMEETERMEHKYEKEPMNQGPLLAVHELGIRFLDMDD